MSIPLAAGTTPMLAAVPELRSAECAPVPMLRAADAMEGIALPEFPRDHSFGFETCTGRIRPGAQMTSPAGCTLSFTLRDSAGTYYTGSAAHCVGFVGQRVSANGVGAFGTVVTDGALGVDYALIRIDSDKNSLVSATLCAWGGPIGADPGDRPPGDILLEYAWGFATSASAQTRTRALVQIDSTSTQVVWAGVGSGGDSGGPIVSVEGYAVGSHTAGVTPLAGVVYEYGPSFARMLASGRTAVPSLQLVTGDPTNVELLAQQLRSVA